MDTSKPIKFSIKFTLYPADLAYILRMATEEDHRDNGRPHIDLLAMSELWAGITGHHTAEAPEGVERYTNDCDYDAYSQFIEKVQAIHDKIVSANSPLHVLAMATEE